MQLAGDACVPAAGRQDQPFLGHRDDERITSTRCGSYWNMMDFTPEGRPDIQTPPQNFRSEFLEKHYLNK